MVKGTSQEHPGPHAPLKPEGDDIWHPLEVATAKTSEILDPRTVPEYEIKYKQAVTAEDVFLGVGITKIAYYNEKINVPFRVSYIV